MIKKVLSLYLISGLFLIALPVLARPNFVAVKVQPAGKVITVPQQAVEVSPALYYLGEAVDLASGKLAKGYAYIHYQENYAKPPWAGGNKNPGSSCYGFLSNNAKWRTVEPWLVNPENTSGLANSFVLDNLTADIAKWEDGALDGVINGNSYDILGTGTSTNTNLTADLTVPDGNNEVYFADVNQAGAIAITIVWGIFSGPPSQRQLLEWDQVYDDVDYGWSSSGQPNLMDFENIATHELGHSVGMADIYESNCSLETMYGYADYGEINKRTLEAGDLAGISQLY